MAMRLADTFLVHPRSCFVILFSGQTPHWSLPRFFGNTTRLHCPMGQAYEYRTDVCQNRVYQAWVHTLAVKYPCDAFRARAADDSIGGHHMLKFLNALAALAAVGTFVIAFLDSYEVRFKVRRRTRGADGGRHLRRKRK